MAPSTTADAFSKDVEAAHADYIVEQPVERADIVTVTATQSAAPTATDASSSTSTSSAFPVAVAVPAMIGGMLLALAGAGLWWYYAKKRDRERRRRWEVKQRRQQRKRDRANSAASRPSMSSTRAPMVDEKIVPPVPALPKEYKSESSQAAHALDTSSEKEGGFYFDPKDAAEYELQPSIDQYEEVLTTDGPDDQSTVPLKPSRSAKRKTAAELAAAKEGGDPNERYRPSKPSPLALAKQQQMAANSAMGGSQELLQPYDNSRATSGEWGVALGSPNHDGSFAQHFGSSSDPYAANQGPDSQRAPSGQYSTDPYAIYHGGDANTNGRKWGAQGQGGGWV